MVSSTIDQHVVRATEEEQASLAEIEGLLRPGAESAPALVGRNGEPVVLPAVLVEALRHVVHLLAHDRAATIVSMDQDLTTQQAADLLNVSRPYLVRLLNQGAIPYTRTGTHRRIRLGDVLAYRRKRDAERGRLLDSLTQISQEMGLYARR